MNKPDNESAAEQLVEPINEQPNEQDNKVVENKASDTEEPITELSLEQQLEQAQAEAAKNWDTVLRTQAEIDNIRKRSTKDIEATHKFAMQKFANELLNIADSMELGLKAADDKTATIESIKEGMALTSQQLFGTFENLNIEFIDAAGTKFNPELHEAMTMVVDTKVKPNTVLEVIQKGYTLNQRLLRPSRVIVSKAK